MIRRRPRPAIATALLGLAATLALLGGLATAPSAQARTVSFDGKRVPVPQGWQVIRLAENPRACVRLDRRAVYLGTPSPNQSCPADVAVGKRRAIVVEPGAQRARSSAGPTASASAGGSVYTGLGFDACTAPSARSMAAWLRSSPFRAVGVYIGGLNRACSQPNLTADWVAEQTAAGWHLIPTYVGLQAPTSSCTSCAKLSLNQTQARVQGVAAANDAVAQAAALGMGPGSPIYNDMESYTRTSGAVAATLAFLEAWTERLHQLGYVSGVYSSSGSGIADLARQVGTLYDLPDALWIANWDGVQGTSDPNVPDNAWANQQRIKQYRGGHNETWGSVTINIDSNYLDGPTVGAGGPGPDDPVGTLEGTGSPRPGHVRIRGWAFDPNGPAKTLAIRAYVGGRAGTPGAQVVDFGPIANVERPELATEYPRAGALHGFDATFPTPRSGSQQVCVYAINLGRGTDSLLGCEATRIPIAVTFSNLRPTRYGAFVRLSCAWPSGTACPGQLALRTRVKVRVPGKRGRPARMKAVQRSLARRTFKLTGGRSHGFRIRLSPGGRAVLRQHGKLRVQLVAAIPGGRRIQVVELALPRRR